MGDHSRIGDSQSDTYEGEVMTLRREPALLWIGAFAPIVAALAAFVFAADPITQGIVNAAAVAIAGAVTAFLVKSDNLLPLITGAIQAVIAAIVAFGAHWDSSQQAMLTVALGVIASIVVRDRVSAPVPAPTVNA